MENVKCRCLFLVVFASMSNFRDIFQSLIRKFRVASFQGRVACRCYPLEGLSYTLAVSFLSVGWRVHSYLSGGFGREVPWCQRFYFLSGEAATAGRNATG